MQVAGCAMGLRGWWLHGRDPPVYSGEKVALARWER